MVAKSRIWMFVGGFHRVIPMYLVLLLGVLVFLGDGITINAQVPNEGTTYLDQMEFKVKEIARVAVLNNNNCSSLTGCSAECSRVACYPVSGGRNSLQCTSVDNNELYNICPRGACGDKMLIDYNRSFVRLPAPASTKLRIEVARDICLQRNLDSTFKTLSFHSNYSNVYFGSTSGAFRAFPGREQNEVQCISYDPRKRPWYVNGISVSKDVKILVDVGNSMGREVTVEYSRPPGTTYLDVTKNITLGLLQTFLPGDYVEVFSFDSGVAMSLGGAVQINNPYDYFNPNPELAGLVADVNTLTASPVTATSSDLNGAIFQASSAFNQLQSLKVIIVLSNGLFVVNSTTFPSTDLQKKKARLLVYKVPTNDDGGDPFLLKTALKQNICSVNGLFESLDPHSTVSPLYCMRSYFTDLARIQLSAVGRNVTWSNKFTSVSQRLNVTTPTYPAFGSDGLLIGVAGVDVIIDNLPEPLKTLVYEDFKRRSRGTLQAPASISMTCSYQNTSANPVCLGSTTPDSSTICPWTDRSSSFADLTCCGTCGSGIIIEKPPLKPWMIALISIAGAAALLLCAVVGICCCKKPKKAEIDFTVWREDQQGGQQ